MRVLAIHGLLSLRPRPGPEDLGPTGRADTRSGSWIVVCLVLRFAWGGLEGPPFPFWTLSYVAGAAGIFLTYTAWFDRKQKT